MKMPPSLFLSEFFFVLVWSCFSLVLWLFWSLKSEIKGPAIWSRFLHVQLHLLGFWYHSEQDFSSFPGLWLNFLQSFPFRCSQMSQLTLPWHVFLGKKDVKNPCHSFDWIFSCHSAIVVLINTEENWHQLLYSPVWPGHVQFRFAGWSANFVGG